MKKKEIKKILVPLDDSNTAKNGLEEAAYIAKLSDAQIIGLHVVVVHPTLVSTVTRYRDFLVKKAKTMLNSAQNYCEKQEIKFSSKILYGKPASRIVEFAKKENVDLIVIGSSSVSGLKGVILGSVANSVTHKSKISVLVVK